MVLLIFNLDRPFRDSIAALSAARGAGFDDERSGLPLPPLNCWDGCARSIARDL